MLTRRAFQLALAATPFAFALPPRPKLFVVLVAGHFRPDYFDTHAATFSNGGFKRLLAGGSYFPNCFQQSVSFGSSGVATIATGTYPVTHGIISDRWFDTSSLSVITAQASSLEATTFAAAFLASDSRNRIFSIGQDPLQTRILSGVTPFTPATSHQLAPDTSARLSWTASGVRAAPLRTLDPGNANEFDMLWRSSPWSQSAEFSFARELVSVNKIGKSEGIDLLLVNLESLASLGLEAGANSPLVFDMVNRLDREVEILLKFLDDTVGENAYQVAFTAAHGICNSAEKHIAAQEIAHLLSNSCDLEAYIYPYIYLRSGAIETALKSIPQVAAWYTASGSCSHTGVVRQRLRNSFHTRRSGSAMIAYAPSVVEEYAGNRGISYGSIYNYDTRVPVIFFGPQFRAIEIEDSVELSSFAPTLCRALGVEFPSTSSGRVLSAAFRQ
jgi:predicted AlkP superfamily pyrophosphatase or phosphodiesterase